MNEKSGRQNQQPRHAARLTRVTRLFRRAQDSLHTALGRSPTYAELEEWTGVSERTVQEWCNNNGRPSAEFALQLLERIPERQRHEIVDSSCRVYPTLEHPRLKCDQTIISRLKTIIREQKTLVLIQGSDDESRTFLLTAMGHAFLSLTAKPHGVAGLDAHEPDWFVPLPGVRYFGNIFHPEKLLQVARNNWPEAQTRGGQFVVFNAMGILMVDFHKQIKELTGHGLVIIAEPVQVKPSLLKRSSQGSVNIITISKHPDNSKGVTLSMEAI